MLYYTGVAIDYLDLYPLALSVVYYICGSKTLTSVSFSIFCVSIPSTFLLSPLKWLRKIRFALSIFLYLMDYKLITGSVPIGFRVPFL